MDEPSLLQPPIKPQILVVDDEPNIRAPLVRAFALEGYGAHEAGSGVEALELLGQIPIDLVVLDLKMPGMNGTEFMYRARQIYPNLLIIVLTGHATLDSAIAAVKTQATDYLIKPATTRDIIGLVSKVLHKHAHKVRRRHLMRILGQAIDDLRQVTAAPLPAASEGDTPADSIMYAYPLVLDCQKRVVMLNDNPAALAHLTDGETIVLGGLMAFPNQVLSCSRLVRAAWNIEMDECEAQSVVRPHVSRLRRKINTVLKQPDLIHTVRGRGYLFASVKT
ncbi:MAG: response regulator [Anaerolineae bacterium]